MRSFLVVLSLSLMACNGEEVTVLPPVQLEVTPMGGLHQHCRNTTGDRLCDAGMRCAHLKTGNDLSWKHWRCIDKWNDAFENYDIYYSEIDTYNETVYGEEIPE